MLQKKQQQTKNSAPKVLLHYGNFAYYFQFKLFLFIVKLSI